MKATIKKRISISGDIFIEVFAGDSKFSQESFYVKDEKTEKEAIERALIIAKNIESDVARVETIYETGIKPIDYFIASNMNDEQLNEHLKKI